MSNIITGTDAVQIQVSGKWADAVGSWRPAITGTLNQTGGSDADASTFASADEAWDTLQSLLDEGESFERLEACGTTFRVVGLE